MSESLRVQRIVAEAMTSEDPAAYLRAAADDPSLADATRSALAKASADGVQLSALIVARLRFERLMHGSREAREWFERDARAFTAVFKRYHRTVAPTERVPTGEAELFAEWLRGSGA